jgi:uncharacterized membrane protein
MIMYTKYNQFIDKNCILRDISTVGFQSPFLIFQIGTEICNFKSYRIQFRNDHMFFSMLKIQNISVLHMHRATCNDLMNRVMFE